MNLQEKFTAIAELYIEAFLRKHNLFDDENGDYSEWEWVGSDVGGIIEVADYFIGFDDIRYDIDNCIEKDNFFEWYDYVLENEKKINYKSYLKGAR